MSDEKAREVAIALSQNLIQFHKGRRASARTPINIIEGINMIYTNKIDSHRLKNNMITIKAIAESVN
jgi:hypothetical protein